MKAGEPSVSRWKNAAPPVPRSSGGRRRPSPPPAIRQRRTASPPRSRGRGYRCLRRLLPVIYIPQAEAMGRKRMRKVAGALAAAFVLAAPVHAATTTTEHRTIADLDGDNRLEPGAGRRLPCCATTSARRRPMPNPSRAEVLRLRSPTRTSSTRSRRCASSGLTSSASRSSVPTGRRRSPPGARARGDGQADQVHEQPRHGQAESPRRDHRRQHDNTQCATRRAG